MWNIEIINHNLELFSWFFFICMNLWEREICIFFFLGANNFFFPKQLTKIDTVRREENMVVKIMLCFRLLIDCSCLQKLGIAFERVMTSLTLNSWGMTKNLICYKQIYLRWTKVVENKGLTFGLIQQLIFILMESFGTNIKLCMFFFSFANYKKLPNDSFCVYKLGK